VSSVSESGGRSTGRVVTAVILAIIAILFIVFGIIGALEPAKSVPAFVPDGHMAGSTGHRPLHDAGWLVLGVIFFVAAWFALRFTPKASAAADSPENTPAGQR
jgi:quinol-cytochrome oxidoreductase complex cytochrome b subunit